MDGTPGSSGPLNGLIHRFCGRRSQMNNSGASAPEPPPSPPGGGLGRMGCSGRAATATLPLPRLRPFLVLSRRCGLNGPPHCVEPRHLNPHCLDSPAGRPMRNTLLFLRGNFGGSVCCVRKGQFVTSANRSQRFLPR